jgi:hypothetical protein
MPFELYSYSASRPNRKLETTLLMPGGKPQKFFDHSGAEQQEVMLSCREDDKGIDIIKKPLGGIRWDGPPAQPEFYKTLPACPEQSLTLVSYGHNALEIRIRHIARAAFKPNLN